MSMTITLRVEDEEHILTVEPGDNFIDLLKNILGNIKHFTYSFDGISVVSADDLVEQLYNNMKIKAECRTRGAPISVGLQGAPLELISHKNPTRPSIKIESVHISCSSDSFDPEKDMVGLIVYSFDNLQRFEFNGHRCRTGYILIKETNKIAHIDSDQGIVHGKLFKWFFGIEVDLRFIGAGFSLCNGVLKYNSSVFNSKNDDYHDDIRSMSKHEISLITYAIKELYQNNKWTQNPTLSVTAMDRKHFMLGSDLPIQNYPKSMRENDIR
jgi:hypothetical protein